MGSAQANEASRLIKDAGFDNSINEGKKLLVPKLMTLTFNIDAVHDHALGWDAATGNWRGGFAGPRFPYDFGLVRDTQDTPSAGASTFDDAPTSKPAAAAVESVEDKHTEAAATLVLGDIDPASGVEITSGVLK